MTARRRLLLSGALLGMHACWFYAWTTMLEGAASAPVRVAHAIILVLICAVVWRFALDRMRLHPLARHAAYWVLWPVVAALVAKSLLYSGEPWLHSGWVTALPGAPVSLFFEPKISELLILLGTGAAWYVGQRQALRAPDYGRLLADFQFGLAMLLVAFLIGYGFDIEPEHPLLLTLAFFGLGIGSITIARSAGESTAGTLSRGQLSVAVVGSICAVCLAALLMASVMRPEVLDAALSVIRYAGSLVGRSIAYIASLLATPEHAGAGAPAAAAGADDSALMEWYRSLPVPAMMRRVLFVLWVSVIGGTLLLALWRLCEQVLEWLRRRRSPLEGAVLESTGRSLWSELATLAA